MADVCVEDAIVVLDGWVTTVLHRCHAPLVVVPTADAKVAFAFVNQGGLVQIVLSRLPVNLQTAAEMATVYWASASAEKAGRGQVATKLFHVRTIAATTVTVSTGNVSVTSITLVLTVVKVAA